VKFLRLDAPVTTILVTSASATEGKTVTAVNLATVLAQSGDRVMLVSADLRRPRAHEALGAPVSPGLTTVLLGEASAAAATYTVQEVPGLHFMAPGPPPPNPAELLESGAARELFHSLSQSYDSVIIDSPPVLPVTDPQVLAGVADAALVVVGYHRTSRRGLKRAIEVMAQVHAPLVGTVFNLVPASEAYGGEPYGYDTYRSRTERRRDRRQRRTEEASDSPTTTLRPMESGSGAGSATATVPAAAQRAPHADPNGSGADRPPT
jgi:capsular exopolysaccharide synthesis family protein